MGKRELWTSFARHCVSGFFLIVWFVYLFLRRKVFFRKKRCGLLCCIVMQMIFRFSLLSSFDFIFGFPSLFYPLLPSCKSGTQKKKGMERMRKIKKKIKNQTNKKNSPKTPTSTTETPNSFSQ